MSTKTTLTPIKEIQHDWYVVDAADQRLGRLATEIAQIIRGKRKANYTPNMDVGDFVVVVNAEKVVVTGNKSEQKLYR
ncbi:MAG: 50S ribosomal protein L13, partial [Cyanobacteria bacterium J06635_11]